MTSTRTPRTRVATTPALLSAAGARRLAAFSQAADELDAVIDDVVAAGGPEAVNVSAIATSMGVARSTVYRMAERRAKARA